MPDFPGTRVIMASLPERALPLRLVDPRPVAVQWEEKVLESTLGDQANT